MNLLTRFKNYCHKNILLTKSDSILLGVSGGPDSLAMLDLFSRIREEFKLDLYVFHLNHMFRKEADDEANFVAEVCNDYNIDVFIKKYDVPALVKKEGMSPEEAAREARFKFMQQKAAELDVKKIALAHNKDDNIETILFNICRGTALKGLTGINPLTHYRNMIIIHPVLNINSYEIEKYCQKLSHVPRRDPSNEQTIYVRNKIRHKIIPYIEDEINPGFKDVIIRMAGIIREEDNFLTKMAAEEFKESIIKKDNDKIMLSLTYLQGLSTVIRRRIIQQVINELRGQLTDLYYEHLKTVDDFILNGKTGKEIYLPEELRIKRVYDRLIIKQGDFDNESLEYNIKLEIPGKINLPDNREIETAVIDKNVGWMEYAAKNKLCLCDYHKIAEPLYVRTRKAGDKFQPLGMNGMKKVKDYFIDEKIAPARRERIPIIVDSKKNIVWIAGMRMHNSFKVTDATKKILKIIIK